MGIIAETATWEPTIYSLETTDPVEGGVTGISNQSRKELANRTAKIKEVLAKHGIEVDPASAIGFTGQWVDVDPTFEGSVIDSDVVYYHIGNAQYEKALADGSVKQHFVGVADVSNGKVIGGGFLGSPVITGIPIQGDTIYLSDSAPGVMTTTASPVAVGKWLFTGTMMLNAGVGGSGGGSYRHEQDSYRMLIDGSYYKNGFFHDFVEETFFNGNTMTFNFAEDKLEFTIGQAFDTLNLKDPLVALTIDEAFLSVDIDDTGATLFEVTADGGANWEVASNNAVHLFANTGSDLRLRITGGGAGEVRSYVLMYNPEVALKPTNLTDIPTDEIILFESDVSVVGYVMQVDQDDQLVYISSGGAAGMKPGSTWTQPLHDHGLSSTLHNHKWFNYTGAADESFDSAGNPSALARNNNHGPADAKLVTAANDDLNGTKDFWTNKVSVGGSTDDDGPVNTWRPRGRNFTRQKRL